ncbi:TPA: fimbrial protein [Pseudomonas putida]|nr:fimbrial protein [Pseudomonas putida]
MIYEGLTYDIYDTGVKGLGLIMTAQDASQRYVPFTSNEIKTVTAVAPAAFSSYPWSRSSQFAIRYVLTERPAVGSLSIPGQSIMRHGILTELDGYNGWGTVTTLPGKLQTSYPSCTVQAPSTVALPRLDASYLQSPGQYYDAYQLKLTVSCFPGVNASYTMTDISNEANRSSVLTLAPGGTAQGVSFQLADNNEPVSYGPALSIQGNINQRFFGVIPDDGLLSKSLDVRYIRTAGPLTPGTLRAGATITMSYN